MAERTRSHSIAT